MVWVEITSTISTICIGCLLFPEIVHIRKRKSSAGLSLNCILWWHLACLLVIPFLIVREVNFIIITQWIVFHLASTVIELQIYLYSYRKPNQFRIFALFLVITALCIGIGALLWALFSFYFPDWLVSLVGGIFSAVCLAIGFIPQMYVMVKEKTGDGFSYGLIFLDIVGASFGIIAIVLESESGTLDWSVIASYIVLIVFEVFIFILKAFVFIPKPNTESVLL
eukprot:c18018_g1_i1.p1 GENE.c18018_g1_i1~~c18018_g1_i1.p1  ORF type:complete len:223 (-),score=43.39 c18018_g1_i1:24-692(-)